MGVSDEKIRAHVLENAIKYNGKANFGAVVSGLFSEGLKKDEIKEYSTKIRKIIKEINVLPIESQKEAFSILGVKISKRKIRIGLPKLINAKEGKVVMRFAPFPSGPLHIGNARTLLLNDEYVRTYNGKLLLVMDDTIGSAEKPIEPEAYKLIEESVKWLGVNYDKVIRKSDRIEKYYEYAEELIKKGYMYVCGCEEGIRRENKINKVECSCRIILPSEQLNRWRHMFKSPEGSYCVRLKTSMNDPDPAFRDRVMFRISDRHHAITKDKYRVYPLLDFSWAIDDHVFGITHILRGMELATETRTEKFIWDIFGWKHPEVIYNGHFELEGIKISKSKGSIEVRSKKYIGWNDPRIWSLQSLRDRGISPKAIRKFILDMGLRKTNITIPVDVLYSINRKIIGEKRRVFFLESPRKIKINGSPKIRKEIPFNLTEDLGGRSFEVMQEVLLSEKDLMTLEPREYRLMNLMDFKAEKISNLHNFDFSFISTDSRGKKLKFFHWLSANEKNVRVMVRMVDGSLVKGLGEPYIAKLKEGEMVYFERFGFVRLHKIDKDGIREFWFAHD